LQGPLASNSFGIADHRPPPPPPPLQIPYSTILCATIPYRRRFRILGDDDSAVDDSAPEPSSFFCKNQPTFFHASPHPRPALARTPTQKANPTQPADQSARSRTCA